MITSRYYYPDSITNRFCFLSNMMFKTGHTMPNRIMEPQEGACDQRIFWSDCADTQADLSLLLSHTSLCRFHRAQAHISKRAQ